MIINVHQRKNFPVQFDTLKVRRDWMDETFDKHAYHCFPVSLANQLGWTFSYPKDISFIWKGKDPNSVADDIEILSGGEYIHPNRANGTISFTTGLTFQTEENLSILIMPVPNQFIDGAQCFTSIVSTSVLKTDLPAAWKVTRSNEIITIPANTPIASIIPISIKSVENFEVILQDENFSQEYWKSITDYGKGSEEKSKLGQWTDFYRNATDEKDNIIGEHESKNIKLKIKDTRSGR